MLSIPSCFMKAICFPSGDQAGALFLPLLVTGAILDPSASMTDLRSQVARALESDPFAIWRPAGRIDSRSASQLMQACTIRIHHVNALIVVLVVEVPQLCRSRKRSSR